ncbi:MAG: hypothetical protein IPJ47_06865 [Anaerolineales bacterium]|nr:hypothetical protein [Anaerolineales bacterium]
MVNAKSAASMPLTFSEKVTAKPTLDPVVGLLEVRTMRTTEGLVDLIVKDHHVPVLA